MKTLDLGQFDLGQSVFIRLKPLPELGQFELGQFDLGQLAQIISRIGLSRTGHRGQIDLGQFDGQLT